MPHTFQLPTPASDPTTCRTHTFTTPNCCCCPPAQYTCASTASHAALNCTVAAADMSRGALARLRKKASAAAETAAASGSSGFGPASPVASRVVAHSSTAAQHGLQMSVLLHQWTRSAVTQQCKVTTMQVPPPSSGQTSTPQGMWKHLRAFKPWNVCNCSRP
jgi:hypothetical protein